MLLKPKYSKKLVIGTGTGTGFVLTSVKCSFTVGIPLGVNILSRVSDLPLDSDMTGPHGVDPSRTITDCRRFG